MQTTAPFAELASMLAVVVVLGLCGWLGWKGLKARPGDAAVITVGAVGAVLLFPIAPLVVLATVGVLVWRARRRRAARRAAAGEAVGSRAVRAWAKAHEHVPGAPDTAAMIREDADFSAVAARCQGDVWPQAMIGAGLARRAHVDTTGQGTAAALGFLVAAATRKGTYWDKPSGTEWHVPEVVTVQPSPVGAIIKVKPLPGQGPADFGTDMRADRIAAHLRAPIEVQAGSPDGLVTLTARWRDPMRDLAPLTDAPAWSGDWAALPLGTAEDGSTVTMPLANVSGLVVGGLPGGGKSASIATALAPLLPRPDVQFVVLDGKGGSDWSWVQPRAARFNNDDEDLARAADDLEALVAVMRHRLQTIRRTRGGSSIWNTGGPSPDMPLMVCLVDECQTYLDKTGIPKGDKDKEAARARCEAALATLVRKGRSVGMLAVLTTQKPTSDSLPTTIGANAAASIALRVKSSPAEVAIFGEAPADDEPSARDLPPVPGYAIIGQEDGKRLRFRFGYLPEDRLERLALDSAALADPAALTFPTPEAEDAAPAEPTDDAAA